MLNKVTIPYALSLWHLFAFAVLIFAALPVTPANVPLPMNESANSAKAERKASLRGQAVIDMVPMAERSAFIRYELSKALNRTNFAANNRTGRIGEPRLFLDQNLLLDPAQLVTFETSIFYNC
ncbi:unnamed protein product [Ceratitis capitata]|uniref:(Mediterranean fruit fly) hypothetical protein n=1 Tax=Ceratitis capitata TaxID=7213 RepID=A0A811V0C5_CERCA|nr:unnamed protein product [Ceratitis capitata]